VIIGGYQPCSLCDYPGRVAFVVFTQGCNFRCPFCHNKSLLPIGRADNPIDIDVLLDLLKIRKGKIDSVVITGGEPTVHNDLRMFLERLRSAGISIKLDTNGTNPKTVASLIQAGLLDYIAMDIKAPFHKYDELTGVNASLDSIIESIRLIADSGLAHEFRTTVVPDLLSEKDISEIRKIVPTGSKYHLQAYRAIKLKH
jgi:pyruvate formate lyase activating enzyme